MQRPDVSDVFPLGSKLPAFSLKNVDGKTVDQSYLQGAKAALVIFSCNHCPYVQGTDGMLLGIVKKFQADGLKVVSISSNDAVQYPEDGFEKMKEKAATFNLPFPYLYDETQSVAKKFDAQCTPECYLFDSAGTLVFHGTINNNPKNPTQVSVDYLSPAIAQVLEGNKPSPDFVHPIGCSIKWKR